jgi:hypothetical protein
MSPELTFHVTIWFSGPTSHPSINRLGLTPTQIATDEPRTAILLPIAAARSVVFLVTSPFQLCTRNIRSLSLRCRFQRVMLSTVTNIFLLLFILYGEYMLCESLWRGTELNSEKARSVT